MRKILFFILAGISAPSLADTTKVFPENPKDLKSCYHAGQAWLRFQMWEMKPVREVSATTFNGQLAACTWKTPEASNFRWPDEYEIRSKAPYNNILGLTPQGDWTVLSYSNDSLDAVTYLRISKKTPVTERFYSASLKGYFFGFDFAAYDLEKSNRAFGAHTVSLNEQGSSTHLDLFTSHEGQARLVLQAVKDSIAYDTETKKWLVKKCVYKIGPDPKNSLSAIIEKCRQNEAKDTASLQKNESQLGPDNTHMLRWNGDSYKEGEPTEWLAKKSAGPIKIPQLVIVNTKSATKEKDGIQYQSILLTKTPQGRKAAVSSIQWLEISAGVEPAARKKINQALKSLAFYESDGALGPDINYEGAKPVLQYGESTSAVEFVSVTKDFLTVAIINTSFAYGHRSYDSKNHVIYSLTSGDVVTPAAGLFKSRKALDLFGYWSTDFFKNKLYYLVPKRWMVNSVRMSIPSLTFIPVKEGIQVLAADDLGGHYFEDVIGVVPYSKIPAEWMVLNATGQSAGKTLLLRPRLNCASELERPEEQKICHLKLGVEYEAVLALWQARLESQSGEVDEENTISSEFIEFQEKLGQCGEDRECSKKVLEEEKAQPRVG